MVRAVSSHRDQTVRAGVRQGSREGETIVYYDTQGQTGDESPPAPDLASVPQLVVYAPDGTSSTVALEKTAPDHYEARLAASQRGLYRVVSGSGDGNSEVALPQVGFSHNAEEMKPQA